MQKNFDQLFSFQIQTQKNNIRIIKMYTNQILAAVKMFDMKKINVFCAVIMFKLK